VDGKSERLTFFRKASPPEQMHLQTEKQQHVRAVLSRLPARDAELLLL
jgi:hypothetical protein